LSWNGCEDIKNLINSVIIEKEKSSYDCVINVIDNGSIDGTVDYLSSVKEINVEFLDKNYGIAIAENKLIKKAINNKSKYMFMFDGDVIIVPASFDIMVDWMETHKAAGCLGQFIDNCTKKMYNASNTMEINDVEFNIKSGSGAARAWTHYGIYRVELFEKGIRFDENDVFGMAGYGFDDDNLGMEITKMGYDIACFKNICIYHNLNSSIPKLMEDDGLNYNERKQYFMKKWNL
jgi:GT2 family glycosyltransferase